MEPGTQGGQGQGQRGHPSAQGVERAARLVAGTRVQTVPVYKQRLNHRGLGKPLRKLVCLYFSPGETVTHFTELLLGVAGSLFFQKLLILKVITVGADKGVKVSRLNKTHLCSLKVGVYFLKILFSFRERARKEEGERNINWPPPWDGAPNPGTRPEQE